MKLIITLNNVDDFSAVRKAMDKASIASYPKYSMDTEKDLKWNKPTLVCVGTPNEITHAKSYVLKKIDITAEIDEQKGY